MGKKSNLLAPPLVPPHPIQVVTWFMDGTVTNFGPLVTLLTSSPSYARVERLELVAPHGDSVTHPWIEALINYCNTNTSLRQVTIWTTDNSQDSRSKHLLQQLKQTCNNSSHIEEGRVELLQVSSLRDSVANDSSSSKRRHLAVDGMLLKTKQWQDQFRKDLSAMNSNLHVLVLKDIQEPLLSQLWQYLKPSQLHTLKICYDPISIIYNKNNQQKLWQGVPINTRALQQWISKHSTSQQLRRLYVANCAFDSVGNANNAIKYLIQGIQCCPKLQQVEFVLCGFPSSTSKPLAQWLNSNKKSASSALARVNFHHPVLMG